MITTGRHPPVPPRARGNGLGCGQIIFLALVPVLRRMGNDVLTPVARQLTRILWAGFALLIATGIWNLVAVDLGSQSQAYRTTL